MSLIDDRPPVPPGIADIAARMRPKGCPVICIDARHAKAVLSLKVNKTDPNDALGLAQIMRVGWYREVTVKGHDCQALRALLVARAQIVSQITTVKNCVRGILKTFGHVLPKKLRATYIASVREIIEGHATLERWSSCRSMIAPSTGSRATARPHVI